MAAPREKTGARRAIIPVGRQAQKIRTPWFVFYFAAL